MREPGIVRPATLRADDRLGTTGPITGLLRRGTGGPPVLGRRGGLLGGSSLILLGRWLLLRGGSPLLRGWRRRLLRRGRRALLPGKGTELRSAERTKITVRQGALVTVRTCGEGDLVHCHRDRRRG